MSIKTTNIFQEWLSRFISWRIANISERTFIYIISLLVGILSGLAALALKKLIHLVEVQLTGLFTANTFSYAYIAYPIAGMALAWMFVRYLVKDDLSHGVTRILFAISRKGGRLKRHNTWSSMVASSMTIGLGGSVGAEAPIVLTGASIGSNLARLFKLNYKYVILMIGCGAAGAIAGIFKAPIAGIIFTLEVLMLDMTMAYIIPLLISSITAASLSYIFMGSAMVMQFEMVNAFSTTNIGYYILLGIFAGFISLYFTRSILWQEAKFRKIGHPLLRLFTGGVLLSFLVFLLPPLWGEGYTSIIKIFNGDGAGMLNNSIFYAWKGNPFLFMLFLVLIIALKVVATAATTGGGGVGGIFAPTLFTGAVSGYLVAFALNTFFQLDLPEENFALAGMAGLMAGVMQAPLTAIFLTAEITGGYGLFIPLIITSTVSYLTIMRFERHSIYTKRLAIRGDLITHHKDKAVLKLMQTRNLIETDFEILSPDATLRDLAKAISNSQRNLFPVVDSQGIMKGMVKLSEVRSLIFETGLYDKVKIKDLMYMPRHYVSPRDSMEEVADKFETSDRFNLAVIDNGKYIGFLSRAKVFSEYRDNIRDFSSD
jgi:CIC family chloride channel protein